MSSCHIFINSTCPLFILELASLFTSGKHYSKEVCLKTFTCMSNVSSYQFAPIPKNFWNSTLLINFQSSKLFSSLHEVKMVWTCAFAGLRTGVGSHEAQSRRARSFFTLDQVDGENRKPHNYIQTAVDDEEDFM